MNQPNRQRAIADLTRYASAITLEEVVDGDRFIPREGQDWRARHTAFQMGVLAVTIGLGGAGAAAIKILEWVSAR